MKPVTKLIMASIGFHKEVEAVMHGFCPLCKKPITLQEFKDELSYKEFKISGTCQTCQDDIFTE
jgi:hypothetical protein